MSKVTVVESLEQFKEIIAKDTFTVFDFWATWCGPCKMISPIFEKLAAATEHVSFYKVDIDAVPDVAQEVGISAMPTFILFKNGSKVDELVGANPPQLTALIAKAGEK